jgi:DNA repair exonuclease SbcCD nuclease subunit
MGDAHWRSATPARRKDKFADVQFRKTCQVFDIYEEYDANILINTGDLFDTDGSDWATVNRYTAELNERGITIYCPPGNHDVYGAALSTIDRSAFGNLVANGHVQTLDHEGVCVGDATLYGTSYMHQGKPKPVVGGQKNILVAHEMILENKIWREQEDFTFAHSYLTLNRGWDIILCGHYHYSFLVRVGDRIIANPGALVRIKASKGDMELKPGVLIIDTDTLEVERVELDYAPVEEVFDLTRRPEKVEPTAKFTEFLSSINLDLDLDGDGEDLQHAALSEVTAAELEKAGVSEGAAALVHHYIGEVLAS